MPDKIRFAQLSASGSAMPEAFATQLKLILMSISPVFGTTMLREAKPQPNNLALNT